MELDALVHHQPNEERAGYVRNYKLSSRDGANVHTNTTVGGPEGTKIRDGMLCNGNRGANRGLIHKTRCEVLRTGASVVQCRRSRRIRLMREQIVGGQHTIEILAVDSDGHPHVKELGSLDHDIVETEKVETVQRLQGITGSGVRTYHRESAIANVQVHSVISGVDNSFVQRVTVSQYRVDEIGPQNRLGPYTEMKPQMADEKARTHPCHR